MVAQAVSPAVVEFCKYIFSLSFLCDRLQPVRRFFNGVNLAGRRLTGLRPAYK